MRNKLFSLEERRLHVSYRNCSARLLSLVENYHRKCTERTSPLYVQDFKESSVRKQWCHPERTETRGTLLRKGSRCHGMFTKRWHIKICLSFL